MLEKEFFGVFPGHSAFFPHLSLTGSVWFLLCRDSCGPCDSQVSFLDGPGTLSLKPGADMFLQPFEKDREIQDLHLSLKLKENHPSTLWALQRFRQSEKV